jgi:PAS domain S-box-containing protein
MEPFYYLSAGGIMKQQINGKQPIIAAVLVTILFVLFAAMLQRFGIPAKASGGALFRIWLPVAGLYGAVMLLVSLLLRSSSRQIDGLREQLALEKENTLELQNNFEENIEKRTYELQVINGTLNREIAERIQAEEEVKELQKQLKLILDSAGEGILGLDNKGKVIFINQAAALMLGWEVDELLGNTHHQLIHHTYADGTPHPEEKCPIYMAYRDGLVHYKTGDVFWTKTGTSFPVEYVSTPIKDRGMLTGAVVVFRDMNTFA